MPQAKAIPEGHHSVQPYVMFKNCVEAIAFYGKAFGAKETLRMPRPDGRIGHAEIQIGDSIVMMADEAPEMDCFSAQHFGGSPVSLLLYVQDCDAVHAQALAAGAQSLFEPADKPYGDRMSGVRDPFGYQWWISTHIEDVSYQEMSAQD